MTKAEAVEHLIKAGGWPPSKYDRVLISPVIQRAAVAVAESDDPGRASIEFHEALNSLLGGYLVDLNSGTVVPDVAASMPSANG